MMGRDDEKLAMALYDVPVPEGLVVRLLERLKSEASAPLSLAAHFTRRWLLAAGGMAALAAGLLVAVWLGLPKQEALSEQFVLDEAIRAFDLGVARPGTLLVEMPAPDEYPFSDAILRLRGTRWRPLEAFLGRRGVVYDLPGPGGATASLYVVDIESGAGFEARPAINPFATAGCCASSWQDGGLLYVLVVQGDPATYRAYLSLPRDPVA